MNKNVVLGAVVLVIVLAGGWYLLTKAPAGGSDQSAAVGEAQTGSGTLGDILTMGSVQCQVSVEENGSASQGVVYVADGKMAGAFATTVDGAQMQAFMINDGSNIYSWSDQSTQGVKMPVSTADMSTTSPSESQPMGATTPAQYSCMPWEADERAFTPPDSVTFVDAGAMMEGAMMGADASSSEGDAEPAAQ